MMLPYELTGNNKSNILVIFLHGFPDSLRLWDCKLYTIIIRNYIRN